MNNRCKKIWGVALVFFVFIVMPQVADASGCEDDYGTGFLVSNSDFVFRGTVLSVTPATEEIGKRNRPAEIAKFKISHIYKGQTASEINVISFESGFASDYFCRFKEGEETAVFAIRGKDGQFRIKSCFMWTYRRFRAQHDHELEKFWTYEMMPISHGDAATFVERGNIRYKMALYKEALSDYQAALSADRKNIDARRGRLLMMGLLGNHVEFGPKERDFSGFDNRDKKVISFAGLDLRKANFRNTELLNVIFSGADLRGADFSGAKLDGCNFDGAQLVGAKFENLKSAHESTFKNAILKHANFRGAGYMDYSKFDGAVLDNADFSASYIDGASFKNASLRNAKFLKTHIERANFQGADLSSADFSEVEFRNHNMCDAKFIKAKLHNANFSKTLFSTPPRELNKANQFCGTNFTGAKFDTVDFSYSSMDNAVFSDAEYDSATIWPQGFDPAKIGAQREKR